MWCKNPSSVRFARLRTTSDDIPVSQHAAYDLSEMDEMRRKGQPIALNQHDSEYYDGSEDATFELSLDQCRGVDINDAWNQSRDLNRKLSRTKVTNFNLNPTQS